MGEITINPTHNVHQKYRQMNLVNPYIFSVPVVATNLYIGGVASTINTPELLAAKFQNYPSGTSFSALNIQNFAIVGSDIKCTVIADYSIRDGAFSNNSLITYYIDNLRCKEIKSAAFFSSLSASGGIYMNIYKVHFENVIVIGSNAFNADFGTYGLKIAEFPNATTASGVRTFANDNKLESIYIPKITTLGDTVVNNEFFLGVKNAKIYANPILQTSNSGGVEGDLSYANSQGNTVRYVPNYTAPNSITNLSVGTIYNSAIQLNFTPPSSTNAIEYYECYVNGVLKNNITASGQYVVGLTSSNSYVITVFAVDIFYNKSLVSNTISISTTNRTAVDTDAMAYVSASSNINYQDIIDDLFVSLKSNSLYTKLQAFYPFLGTTAAQHKWNAKNPLDTNAAFRLVFSGDGIFSNSGYLTNGSNTYANTFYNPTGKITAASSGITIVTGTNNIPVGTQIFDIGAQKNNPNYDGLVIQLKNGASKNQISGRTGLYPQGEVYENSVSDSRGIVSVVSQGLSLRKIFRNGILKSTATTTTTEVMPNYNLFIGSLNNGGSAFSYSNQRFQFTAIHEGLSDSELATLHTIIDIFETALGRKTW